MLLVGLDELVTTGNKCKPCVAAAAALFASVFISEPEYNLDLFPCCTHFNGIRHQCECASVSYKWSASSQKCCDRRRAVVQTPANWLMAQQTPCLRGIHYYPGVMHQRSTKLVGVWVCAQQHCFLRFRLSSRAVPGCGSMTGQTWTGWLALDVERCWFRIPTVFFFLFIQRQQMGLFPNPNKL